MFKYNYKMALVNPEKNIVSLSPTAGTWAKAFAPTLVLLALAGIATLFTSSDDEPDPEFAPDSDLTRS